jgi:hypothetical protein
VRVRLGLQITLEEEKPRRLSSLARNPWLIAKRAHGGKRRSIGKTGRGRDRHGCRRTTLERLKELHEALMPALATEERGLGRRVGMGQLHERIFCRLHANIVGLLHFLPSRANKA